MAYKAPVRDLTFILNEVLEIVAAVAIYTGRAVEKRRARFATKEVVK